MLILSKKVDAKEFIFVTIVIVVVLIVSFALMGTDYVYEVSMGVYSFYEVPQRFMFALFGGVIGFLIVIVMALLLVIKGTL